MANNANIVISNKTSTSCTIAWTPKNTQVTNRSYIWLLEGDNSANFPAPDTGTDYAASSVYGVGDTEPARGYFCMAKPSNDGTMSVDVTGLTPGALYTAAVTDSLIIGLVYDTVGGTLNPVTFSTLAAEPTVPASNIALTPASATTLHIQCALSGADYQATFIKHASSGTPAPVDGTSYTGDVAYSVGSQIGSSGWYCLDITDGDTDVVATGLTAGETYRVMVVRFNGTAGTENYLTDTATGNPANVTMFAAEPTVPASIEAVTVLSPTSVRITAATRGNGAFVKIFVKEASSGTPAPVDGTAYPGDLEFRSGAQIGASGWYAADPEQVTDALSPGYVITGLTPGATVRLALVEYNGDEGAGTVNYYTAVISPVNVVMAFGSPASILTMGVG